MEGRKARGGGEAQRALPSVTSSQPSPRWSAWGPTDLPTLGYSSSKQSIWGGGSGISGGQIAADCRASSATVPPGNTAKCHLTACFVSAVPPPGHQLSGRLRLSLALPLRREPLDWWSGGAGPGQPPNSGLHSELSGQFCPQIWPRGWEWAARAPYLLGPPGPLPRH